MRTGKSHTCGCSLSSCSSATDSFSTRPSRARSSAIVINQALHPGFTCASEGGVFGTTPGAPIGLVDERRAAFRDEVAGGRPCLKTRRELLMGPHLALKLSWQALQSWPSVFTAVLNASLSAFSVALTRAKATA